MKVELHINGKLSLELWPESAIEQMVLDEMFQSAKKGRLVELRGGWNESAGTAVKDKYVVEVER